MPRVARGLGGHLCYHVINRGNAKQEVFHKNRDYETFVRLMGEAKNRHAMKIFAYCLMPNHFHMVVMPERGEELSRYMQWLMTSHVRRYHRHYESSGHVWQGRFKSFLVQDDRHLLVVLRYVEANPVRAGFVKSAQEWTWSSHRARLGKDVPCAEGVIDDVPIDIPTPWCKYVDTPLTEKELQGLRHSIARQSPFGHANWQVAVSKEFGLESTLRPRGRPRKETD